MGGPDVPVANVIPGDIVVDGAPVDIPLASAEVALPEVIVINDDDGDDSAVPVGDEAIPSLLPPLASSIVSGGVGGVASEGPVVADLGEISLGRDPDSPSRKRRRVGDGSPSRESFPRNSSSAPDLVQWVEGQDPASLLNPRVLAEYIRNLAIPDDVTWFCGRPGQELSDLACFHGFSVSAFFLEYNMFFVFNCFLICLFLVCVGSSICSGIERPPTVCRGGGRASVCSFGDFRV